MCIPAILNLGVSGYLYASGTGSEFQGYLLGTVVTILFSFFWIWQVRKGIASNPMVLLKVTFWGFAAKLIVLVAVTFGGYEIVLFDRIYFAISFLLGVSLSVVVEIWFYLSTIKENKG